MLVLRQNPMSLDTQNLFEVLTETLLVSLVSPSGTNFQGDS